jgi:hypothetical protein
MAGPSARAILRQALDAAFDGAPASLAEKLREKFDRHDVGPRQLALRLTMKLGDLGYALKSDQADEDMVFAVAHAGRADLVAAIEDPEARDRVAETISRYLRALKIPLRRMAH